MNKADQHNARPRKEDKYTPNLNEKQVLYYRTHPVQAAFDLLGVKLIWLQRLALKLIWFKRFPLLNMSRGVSKSFLIAVASVLFALLYPKTKIGIIAPVFRQANYVFDFIDEFYNESEYVRAAAVKISSRGAGQSIFKFHNLSFVEALPVGDGNKIRGRRYHIVFIDEYAQMDEMIIKLVVRPMLNVKRRGKENKLVVSSTAYYRWNHYWTLYLFYIRQMLNNNSDYGIVEFDYLDVVNTPDSPYTIDLEIIEMQKNDMTYEEFAMENLALFPSESVSFISARLIDQCTPKLPVPIEPELIQPEDQPTAKYVLGVDCARVAGGDNFAMQILKLDGVHRLHVCSMTRNGITFQEMANLVRTALENFNIIRIHVGSGGGGLTLKDLLAEKWKSNISNETMPPILDMDDPDHQTRDGLHILRLVNETSKKNNELYMNLKADLQHKRLLFPIDVKSFGRELPALTNIYKDILATKRELMVLEAIPQGVYHKFTVPSKYKKDRATALVMAVDAALEAGRIEKVESFGELPIGIWV